MSFLRIHGMKLWGVAIVALLVLLFVGGPDASGNRIYQQIWNSGHLLLFACIALVLLKVSFLSTRPLWLKIVVISSVCVTLGLAIEVLQLGVGRNFSLQDIVSDLFGGYIGLALFTARDHRVTQRMRGLAYPMVFIFTLIGVSPILVVVADYLIMKNNFPVLADFETPFELDRWDSHLASLSKASETVRNGNAAMKVQFSPGVYPDITLKDLVADWRGFKTVRFSVYSADLLPVNMELKIYDKQHWMSNFAYADRFNRTLQFHQGWNDISIDLDEIKSAPYSRELNMADIVSFSLFFMQLDKPVEMYFDGLRLSSKYN